jgi:hypothetical protein
MSRRLSIFLYVDIYFYLYLCKNEVIDKVDSSMVLVNLHDKVIITLGLKKLPRILVTLVVS